MSLTHSELIKGLSHYDAYGSAPIKINLIETATSYLFKAGNFIYKIKKSGNEYSTLAIKEAFCNEECMLSKRFNPNWNIEVLPIMEKNKNIKVGGQLGIPVEYSLKMEALPEKNLLSKLLGKNVISEEHVTKIASRIAEIHSKSTAKDKTVETAKPEAFRALCDDVLFQMKRYFESSTTQPILDMIRHPLEKFIDDNKRLFNKRHRKGRVVLGHGAFLPEHIFVNGDQVIFISPQEVQKKFAVMDVANDVSSLTVELARLNKNNLLNTFLKKYLEISNDQDLLKMLPLFQTYCALKQGVKTCELKVAQKNEKLGPLAMDYFHLAVRFSREIPRS